MLAQNCTKPNLLSLLSMYSRLLFVSCCVQTNLFFVGKMSFIVKYRQWRSASYLFLKLSVSKFYCRKFVTFELAEAAPWRRCLLACVASVSSERKAIFREIELAQPETGKYAFSSLEMLATQARCLLVRNCVYIRSIHCVLSGTCKITN